MSNEQLLAAMDEVIEAFRRMSDDEYFENIMNPQESIGIGELLNKLKENLVVTKKYKICEYKDHYYVGEFQHYMTCISNGPCGQWLPVEYKKGKCIFDKIEDAEKFLNKLNSELCYNN